MIIKTLVQRVISRGGGMGKTFNQFTQYRVDELVMARKGSNTREKLFAVPAISGQRSLVSQIHIGPNNATTLIAAEPCCAET